MCVVFGMLTYSLDFTCTFVCAYVMYGIITMDVYPITQLSIFHHKQQVLYCRWWDDLVSTLNLQSPNTLLPSNTCTEAVNIMKESNLSEIPVIKEK